MSINGQSSLLHESYLHFTFVSFDELTLIRVHPIASRNRGCRLMTWEAMTIEKWMSRSSPRLSFLAAVNKTEQTDSNNVRVAAKPSSALAHKLTRTTMIDGANPRSSLLALRLSAPRMVGVAATRIASNHPSYFPLHVSPYIYLKADAHTHAHKPPTRRVSSAL